MGLICGGRVRRRKIQRRMKGIGVLCTILCLCLIVRLYLIQTAEDITQLKQAVMPWKAVTEAGEK